MTHTKKDFLSKLARKAITHYLETGRYLKISPNEISSKNLLRKQGTFVTLTINGALRGCIGRLEPVKPLYQDVIENAVSAAFFDPRFYPLQKEELDKIIIEISLLSSPQKLNYKIPEKLLKVLTKEKPGVLIKKNGQKATFLPQVWEELKTPEEFLSSLCLKAGLSPFTWRENDLEVFTYTAEVFHE